MRSHHMLAGVAILTLSLLPAAQAGLLVNPGFETGDFTGWSATQLGDSGNWYAQSGTTTQVNGLPVPLPPEGNFAAVADASGPGTQILMQSFMVDPGASSVILSFQYLRNNLGPDYVTPNSLDYSGDPNQQARVDILSASGGALDLGSAVLENVFQTVSGDIMQDSDYQNFSADITSAVAGGGTFQLRFAVVDNLGPFNLGIDNVSIDVAPEPALWFPAAASLVAFVVARRNCARAPRRPVSAGR